MPDEKIQENEAAEIDEFDTDDVIQGFELLNDDQDDSPHHFDSSGHLVVRNPSAFWIPELEITEVIHGTIYTVTGSYEGTERLDHKLSRIFQDQMEGEA